MTATPPAPPAAPVIDRARRGSAWWSARVVMVVRRARGFARAWSASLGALAVLAIGMAILAGDSGMPARAELERLAADTLREASAVRAAEVRVAAAESTLIAARTPVTVPATPRPTSRPEPSSPAVATLARLVDAARRERTPQAFLAVAADPAVSGGPRMRALADTIRALEARRGEAPEGAEATALAQRIARAGVSVIAIADNRRAELAAAPASGPAPAAPLQAPTTVAAVVAAVDTLPLVAALAAARDTLERRQRHLDSLVDTARERAAATPVTRPLSARLAPGFGVLALLLAGLLVRFTIGLREELRAPTLAAAGEAERRTGVRVMTTVRDTLLDGPARFRPSGVDPFRMLYLGLTATGTRARTAVVAGGDPEIAAATGARLAIAAAADHRHTLAVDLDPAHIALSRTFRERAEPGLSDVLARAFSWREVARPVGSSDGLPITLLPAGTERDDLAEGEARATLLAEFARLRAQYELTLVVAPVARVPLALALLDAAPVLLTAVIGETPLDELEGTVDGLRAEGIKVLGLVVWDAPRPKLPSRAELVADLSRRKGRTPGGSFEAVRRAIDPLNRDNKRT